VAALFVLRFQLGTYIEASDGIWATGSQRRAFQRADRAICEAAGALVRGDIDRLRPLGGVPAEVFLDDARELGEHHDAATREVRFNANSRRRVAVVDCPVGVRQKQKAEVRPITLLVVPAPPMAAQTSLNVRLPLRVSTVRRPSSLGNAGLQVCC